MIDTSSATVTIYRAKQRFEYRPGEWIEQGAQWTPKGEKNDRQIMEHSCYEDKVPLSDLLNAESKVESLAGVETDNAQDGDAQANKSHSRGRKAQSTT